MDDALARFERAMDAIRALQNGSPPDLTDAPTIDLWAIVEIERGPALVGVVSGHPEIRDGLVQTSVLLAIAEDRTWARTVSRYYRLGRQLTEGLNG